MVVISFVCDAKQDHMAWTYITREQNKGAGLRYPAI